MFRIQVMFRIQIVYRIQIMFRIQVIQGPLVGGSSHTAEVLSTKGYRPQPMPTLYYIEAAIRDKAPFERACQEQHAFACVFPESLGLSKLRALCLTLICAGFVQFRGAHTVGDKLSELPISILAEIHARNTAEASGDQTHRLRKMRHRSLKTVAIEQFPL